jgi:hypothetical protein
MDDKDLGDYIPYKGQPESFPFEDPSENPFKHEADEEEVSLIQHASEGSTTENDEPASMSTKKACSFTSAEDHGTCVRPRHLRHTSSTSCRSIRLLGLDPAARTPVNIQVNADNLIIIADVPKGHAVGCDIMTPRFTFEQAPAFDHPFHGVHFAWVAREPTDERRSGFFFFTEPPPRAGSTQVLQWNQYAETLGGHGVKVVEKDIAASARAKMHKLAREPLSPVEWERARVWAIMTSHITQTMLKKITHKSADNWRVQSNDPIWDPGHPDFKFHDTNEFFRFSNNELSLRFAKLACMAHDSVSVPASDTTLLIEAFFDSHPDHGPEDLIAEIQFLFVAGAIADNALCFDLWAKMAKAIILHSFGLPEKRPRLAQSLFVTLGAQFTYHDHVSGERLGRLDKIKESLREAIIVYKMRLTETCLMAKCQSKTHVSLGEAFSEMENWLGSRFGDELRGQYIKVRNLDGMNSAKRAASQGYLSAAAAREPDEEMVPFPVQMPTSDRKKRRSRWLPSKWW